MSLELVIDANVLFSATLSRSTTRRLLLSPELSLYAPEYLFDEFADHLHNDEPFREKLAQTEEETEKVIRALKSVIRVIPLTEYKRHIETALKECPDEADAPYLALALALKMPLWSNDKALKKQRNVKVLNTQEILKALEKATP